MDPDSNPRPGRTHPHRLAHTLPTQQQHTCCGAHRPDYACPSLEERWREAAPRQPAPLLPLGETAWRRARHQAMQVRQRGDPEPGFGSERAAAGQWASQMSVTCVESSVCVSA